MHISEDEWNKPTCRLLRDTLSCSKSKAGEEECTKIPANHLVPLKDCFFITSGDLINRPHCSHWNSGDCLAVSINDYILERPDILNTIVAILEKPCQYMPTEESLEKKGMDPKSYSVFYGARKTMNCDKKDKKPYALILQVMRRNGGRRFDIVIKRKE